MNAIPANVEQALNKAEAISRERLATFPRDGVCLHSIEQVAPFRAAMSGNAARLEKLRSEFDLELMAAKALGAEEDEPFADALFEIDAFVKTF